MAAVVLFQLGGPDSPDAVEPFLFNLFMDPDIIDFQFLNSVRRPLARFFSRRRRGIVARHYDEIGGKSPILELTNRQAASLEAILRDRNIRATVFVAMRYWRPLTSDVVRSVRDGGFDRIVLLPLYPQYSKATTLSSTHEWTRQTTAIGLDLPTHLICCYPNHPLLIKAFVQQIEKTLKRFGQTPHEEVDLVFSAHGIPLSFIEAGDPYQLQIEETVHRVVDAGNWKSPHVLCYQSKVGRREWLGPSLSQTVRVLAQKGRKRLLVVPVAFVTEHIETLHEINIEVRAEAHELGIRQFEMMPALNDHPAFIRCLADLVEAQLHTSFSPASKCMKLWEEKPGRSEPVLCPWYPQ